MWSGLQSDGFGLMQGPIVVYYKEAIVDIWIAWLVQAAQCCEGNTSMHRNFMFAKCAKK
jgi:hypothetical protein